MDESLTNQDENYIKGELIHMIYSNQAEHFSIAKIKVLETTEDYSESELVVKGYFSELLSGEVYVFHGVFLQHKKFGLQYQVSRYQRYLPDTKEGLVAYLSSDLFHGVGKKTAERIVDKLGETAVSKILNDASVLDGIQGLNKERKNNFVEKLQEHQGFDNVVIHLSKYGIGLKMIQKIYQNYQENAIETLQTNPYQFVFDIEGFGFYSADEIAIQHGLSMDHPTRLQAGCLFSLQESMQDGHVYLPLPMVIEKTNVLLKAARHQIYPEQLNTELATLHKRKQVIIDEDRVYLPTSYYAESGFCTQIKRLVEQPFEEEVVDAELMKIVGEIEEEEVLSYGKEQFLAIETALTNKVMILTGGPGTGKTTVIKGIIRAYSELYDLSLNLADYDSQSKFPFVLTAPTGRAAKRITESTGLPAKTIHRLLGWDGNEGFEKDENNQLSGSLLVIDEFSMVDVFLANQLFKAIPNDMQVLIVGDEDQLPSVGPGQVLADLLYSQRIKAVKLDEVYRQKEGSQIIQLAHEIKQDKVHVDSLVKANDFNFIPCSESQLVDIINQIVMKAQQKGVELKDIQVLAPMYRTDVGIHRLNKEIQEIVNPKRKDVRELRTKDAVFRNGDKVIQLVNQPEDGVFNGDIGQITAIFRENENVDQEEQVVVTYDENDVVYNRKDLMNIMHAYCISIHKSQGSEFPIIILPVVTNFRRMLRKNLLYTAVTRAKKSLIICGDKQAFMTGIREVDTNKRFTDLARKITMILENEAYAKKIEEEAEEEEALSPYDFLS